MKQSIVLKHPLFDDSDINLALSLASCCHCTKDYISYFSKQNFFMRYFVIQCPVSFVRKNYPVDVKRGNDKEENTFGVK